ncbi:MAG: hypothetical protein IJP03_04020, partial [Christensenellaceae bacterium]|nr:hypothetical protein [Christensenellaceae bacterium]
YYCGLCRALGAEYSLSSRFALSYDTAFLYVLCAALSDRRPEYVKKTCMVHPAKKSPYAKDDGADYAAAVNVLLAAGNLRDDVVDEKKVTSWAALQTLKRAEKKAKRKYPEAAAEIESALSLLTKTEKAGCDDLDEAAHPFGLLLQGVFARCGEQKKVLGQMGYHLGRWIYLMDAYADREKDQKKGSYNPFLRRFPQQGEDMHETAAFVLNSTLAGLKNAYDLLDVKKHKGILDNILQRGLYKKTEELLKIGRGKTENGSV